MNNNTKRPAVELRSTFFGGRAFGTATILLLTIAIFVVPANGDVSWERKSSSTGDNDGKQQTSCLVLDIDKDGFEDFVVGERTRTPSVVWYKYNGKVWDKFIIDNTRKNPEAGG